MTYLQIWPQNIIQSIAPQKVSDCFFSLTNRLLILPSDCPPFTKPLPLFSQTIPSHRSTQPIATLFQVIALVSWPTSPSDCPCILVDITKWLPSQQIDWLAPPSDCLAFLSDWSLCAVTNWFPLLSKQLLAGRSLFSYFHRETMSVHSLAYK